MSYVALVLLVAFTLGLWHFLRVQERAQGARTVSAAAADCADSISQRVEDGTEALSRIAARWAYAGKPTKGAWEADATNMYRDAAVFQAIEWIDPELRIEWVVPLKGNERALNLNLRFEKRRSEAIGQVLAERKIVASGPIQLVQGGTGFLVYAPIFHANRFEGIIAGVFRIDRLVALVPRSVLAGYTFTLSQSGETFYSHGGSSHPVGEQWVSRSSVQVPNATWEVSVSPTEKTVAAFGSPLPWVILATGLITTILSTILIFTLGLIDAERRRVNAIIASITDGLITFDREWRFTMVNPTAERLMGMSSAELCGKDARGVPVPAFGAEWIAQCERAAQESRSISFETRDAAGKLFCEVRAYPFTEGVSAYIHDVSARKQVEQLLREHQSELERANQKLEELASTDNLTGLANQRTFASRMKVEVQRSRRHSRPLSLILLDVDWFKQYNDEFGHPAGDEVLRQIGVILQSHARAGDTAARYGGEEFAIILPETEGEGAVTMAQRLRTAIESARWAGRSVTASFGVATLRTEIENAAMFVEAADSALYRSKREGRNRVTQAGQDDGSVAEVSEARAVVQGTTGSSDPRRSGRGSRTGSRPRS
ncbi:MAG TPA: diguanylate cyclase [Fimbriimonadaceae bacterium]|nr:diguanylate cyclase [Fimbriimonadaceae bacterium]